MWAFRLTENIQLATSVCNGSTRQARQELYGERRARHLTFLGFGCCGPLK